MATKKFMSLERLQEYDALIKAEIADEDASVLSSAKSYTDTSVSNITSGTTVVAEATHATAADSANSATVATTATKLGATTVGSATQPMYLNAGVATVGYAYAGGTKVILNDTAKGCSTASFYAPTSKGVSGYVLTANTSGVPTWTQVLPVANGGTGAKTASDARTNLEIYSSSEVDAALADKSDISHNHDSVYDVKGAANTALASAKTYADGIKNALLNGAGSAYDTLKELGNLIDDNTDAIEALETIASGKANATHAHAISDITNLQTTLNGKAASSHGTHVSYSSTAPVMDGSASVGTASTVARSDHKHPTDTSRASQVDLDSLETVVAGKANANHTHTIANITNLQNTLDGKATSSHTHTLANISDLTATAKELNYVDGVTSSIQTQLDGKAANSHTHSYAGSSSVGGAATSANKVNSSLTVKLNSGTTEGTNMFTFNGSAAKTVNITPSAIGAAASSHTHDDRYYTESEIDTKVSTLNTAINGKAASSHTHTIANVTNLQSTLDGKSSTNHTHNYAGSTSVGGSANALGVFDTRNVNDTPTEMTNLIGGKGLRLDFKQTSTVGLSNGTYSAVMSISPWGDTANWSGGKNTQLGFCDDGRIQVRKGSGSGWTNWNTLIDSSTIGSQSVNYANSAGSATNATKATQLTTARTIALGTGVTGTATSFNGTGNITIPVTDIKEAYLSWGGQNLIGSVSPISAALSTEHSANRIAYLNPAAIKIEYSNDGGSTWADSGLGNSAKVNLVTTSNVVSVGSNSTVTTNHRTRMTFTAQDGTNGYVYTRPRKMLINVSTPHGLTVTIESKTGVSGASWTTLGTYNLSGWSGWNDIPLGISTFGGGANQTGNYWYIRLTFANTSVNSSYTTTKSSIIGLRLFGDTCWTRTSNMGETGHLYSYDYAQNATFPANVTATTFSGTTFSGSGIATVSEVKDYLGI